jgi:hypothetical protein
VTCAAFTVPPTNLHLQTLSFLCTRAISMGITKAESRTLIDAAHHAKGRLCRMRVGAPAALA